MMKDVIADGLIIGMSTALLWHFSNIWRYGEYMVAEPNIIIRSLETALLFTILVFGVSRFINRLKGKSYKNENQARL